MATALGSGAVAVALANEADPTVQQWWIARIGGAVSTYAKWWGGGEK